ncbi:hypothetical protein GCM10010359_53800 [Streptomyces morookaense]|nr:hypothetical protein GCM10010359_53800 [Streptomyces morookaense]
MPSMWATRYASMIRPVTAMTAFLPTVDRHTEPMKEDAGALRVVASAMTRDARPPLGDPSKT